MLKYASPTFFEKYVWDAAGIYFAADDTDNPDQDFYSFRAPGQARTTWLPRPFAPGAALEHDDNVMSRFRLDAASGACGATGADQAFPFSMQFRARMPNYRAAGSMGVVDAVVFSYTYQSDPDAPTGPTYGNERFYFARTRPDTGGNGQGLGWIRWENYAGMGSNDWPEGDPTALTPTQTVDFSSLGSDAPVMPRTQFACGH